MRNPRRLHLRSHVVVLVALLGCVGCGNDREEAPVELPSAGPNDAGPDDPNTKTSDVIMPPESVATSAEASPPGADASPPMFRSDEASAAQLREAALRSLGQNEDEMAYELVRQLMRIAPDHPESIFLHALVLGDRHRFHEAIKILDDLSEEMPATRLPALGQTAEWLVLSGQHDQAESRYREILDARPDSPLVHRHLGQLLLQTGNRIESGDHFRYLGLRGELNQQELRTLISLGKPLAGDGDNGTFEALTSLAEAQLQYASGEMDEALATLNSEAEDDKSAASLRARIRTVTGDWDAVRQWASTGLPDQRDADGWFSLAQLKASGDQHSQAVTAYCRTLLIDPSDAEAYEALGRSLQALDQNNVAAIAKERAVLVRQSQELAAQLANDESKDRKPISQLIDVLEKLQRPLEVLGWRSVDLVYAVTQDAMPEMEAQSTFEAIARERQQMIQSGRHMPDPNFILCGLSVNFDEAESSSSTPPN